MHSTNISYADKSGNIGMWVTGKVPIRGKGKGQFPSPGWTGEYDWVGKIPVNEMPHTFNPECGFIISTNNKPVSDDYPYYLGNSFMNGYRAKRIQEVLFEQNKITIDICKKLHTDFYSIPGKKMKEGYQGFRTARPKAQKVLDYLLDWDCILDNNSTGGIVYEVLLYTMLRNLVKNDFGSELTEKWMGSGEHPLLIPTSELLGNATVVLFDILQNDNSQWLTTDKDAINLMEDSLVDTCVWLESNFGDIPSDWKWGKIHTVSFNHVLGMQKPLDKIFNTGPFEFGGDTDTVCQSAFNPNSPYTATSWCPAFRMIVSLDDFNQTLVMNPTGQSGVYGSKFYDNALDPWLQGEYFRLIWDLSDIVQNQVSKLTIQPK